MPSYLFITRITASHTAAASRLLLSASIGCSAVPLYRDPGYSHHIDIGIWRQGCRPPSRALWQHALPLHTPHCCGRRRQRRGVGICLRVRQPCARSDSIREHGFRPRQERQLRRAMDLACTCYVVGRLQVCYDSSALRCDCGVVAFEYYQCLLLARAPRV